MQVSQKKMPVIICGCRVALPLSCPNMSLLWACLSLPYTLKPQSGDNVVIYFYFIKVCLYDPITLLKFLKRKRKGRNINSGVLITIEP